MFSSIDFFFLLLYLCEKFSPTSRKYSFFFNVHSSQVPQTSLEKFVLNFKLHFALKSSELTRSFTWKNFLHSINEIVMKGTWGNGFTRTISWNLLFILFNDLERSDNEYWTFLIKLEMLLSINWTVQELFLPEGLETVKCLVIN